MLRIWRDRADTRWSYGHPSKSHDPWSRIPGGGLKTLIWYVAKHRHVPKGRRMKSHHIVHRGVTEDLLRPLHSVCPWGLHLFSSYGWSVKMNHDGESTPPTISGAASYPWEISAKYYTFYMHCYKYEHAQNCIVCVCVTIYACMYNGTVKPV